MHLQHSKLRPQSKPWSLDLRRTTHDDPRAGHCCCSFQRFCTIPRPSSLKKNQFPHFYTRPLSLKENHLQPLRLSAVLHHPETAKSQQLRQFRIIGVVPMRGTVLDAECSQSVICHRSITYLEVDHYLTKAFSTTPKWHERVKAPKKPDVSPCLGVRT